jgi:hypothetical protein
MFKQYLGDSVYAEFDGYGVWLTTENGYPDDPRNKIYLEPSVLASLQDYNAYVERKSNETKS